MMELTSDCASRVQLGSLAVGAGFAQTTASPCEEILLRARHGKARRVPEWYQSAPIYGQSGGERSLCTSSRPPEPGRSGFAHRRSRGVISAYVLPSGASK